MQNHAYSCGQRQKPREELKQLRFSWISLYQSIFLHQASPASPWAHVNLQLHTAACQSTHNALGEEQPYFQCFKLATCLFHLITLTRCIAGDTELLIPLHSQNCDTAFYKCLSYLLPSSPDINLLWFCSVFFVIHKKTVHCGQETYSLDLYSSVVVFFSVLFSTFRTFLMISNIQSAFFFFFWQPQITEPTFTVISYNAKISFPSQARTHSFA